MRYFIYWQEEPKEKNNEKIVIVYQKRIQTCHERPKNALDIVWYADSADIDFWLCAQQ